MPFFSIVIVNYNHGQFLEEAIASILNQDCTDYELILIDGGSVDNSLNVINKFRDKFSYCVSEKDNGQSDAFNKGFSKANGKVFFWLNADDLLLPKTLSKAKKYFEQHPNCQWLAGNTVIIDENRRFKWCIRGPLYNKFLVKRGTVYVYGPTSFFSRELFMKSGGFDETLHYTMDTDLWYRFINLNYKFGRLKHYCWALRVHNNSKTAHAFSGQPTPQFFVESKYIQKKNNHFIDNNIEKLQFFWKIITGCFLRKFIDNIKMNGNIF